jgi:hypothetical protein
VFKGNKNPIINAFFAEEQKRIFSIANDGTILLWKWVAERSEAFQNQMDFEEWKRSKKGKMDEKDMNLFLIDDEDYQVMSTFEKEVLEGRYLLEKKQKL